MAEIIHPGKPLAVNPLKVSQPVGASLAFLGLAATMPLEHGARGCASFNKLFFMRHFREPIALQTTAMDQVTTVIGADDNVVEALATICAKDTPAVIGLITTGLSETQGADIPRTIKAFRAAYPQYAAITVVPVNATDTQGCLETGFALAMEAIIATMVPAQPAKIRRPRQINVLASSMLTPGDVEHLKDWIEAFGLTAIVLPDLADSLDGHLIDEGYSTLTYGGTRAADIAALGESAATLVVGRSLGRAADLLRTRTGVPDHRFPGLMGLDECDAFTHVLARLSGRPVPERLERKRSQLLDAMVDCHFTLGGTRVAIAADPDLLAGMVRFCADMGMEVVGAVGAAKAPALAGLSVDRVVVGDLEDLEVMAKGAKAELIVTNSHGTDIAARLGVPLLRAGFPLYDIYGGPAQCWVGYDGSRHTLFQLANLLTTFHQEISPYRPAYWQGTPRDQENGATPC
ncbi:nitrogenase iron-molybdenum cofactor biosynthesis protein NifN [Magnetospirillum aberrantis]|uniref:Nitrogenase iron-molybdenum cofactor biosynthesis protein NifN n=1 Tax=Magnetospirillum aberrantis SpK TaxID=908842 RepID=A0A7C9UXR0_9PROT|nr:nitrogenase iron-molybdenum cofactor biosynthesis protein NifN [Magnetospirillum aberrantis]NFV79271.1 nitrogenase iron-molybdenum cofactor biosynthesis protein NifN [Magnetospirillum aberrantis SpK]